MGYLVKSIIQQLKEVQKGKITEQSKENWLSNELLKKIGWDEIKTSYNNSLIEIIKLLNEKKDDFLKEKYYDPEFKQFCTYQFELYGILHHDIYHLGQIGIVIKMLKVDNN